VILRRPRLLCRSPRRTAPKHVPSACLRPGCVAPVRVPSDRLVCLCQLVRHLGVWCPSESRLSGLSVCVSLSVSRVCRARVSPAPPSQWSHPHQGVVGSEEWEGH
jgi:hypothetical protein